MGTAQANVAPAIRGLGLAQPQADRAAKPNPHTQQTEPTAHHSKLHTGRYRTIFFFWALVTLSRTNKENHTARPGANLNGH
jgi:hypothetical protein